MKFYSRLTLRRQRGVTLIEALVALMVMGFGMVALVSLMTNLRRSSDLGKQRSEAMRIAQAEIARVRSYSVLTKAAGAPISDYDTDIVGVDARSVTPDDSNTTYTVNRAVVDFVSNPSEPVFKSVNVTVSWYDRATRRSGDAVEAPQQVALSSIIARVDPAFGGAVTLPAPAGIVHQPDGRNPVIPTSARKVNDKVSIFRPDGLSTAIWIFNNSTGTVSTCSLPEDTLLSAVTAEQIEACRNPTVGYLLSGTVRFSNSDPANPTTPEALAIPLSIAVVSGTYQRVRVDDAGNPIQDASHHDIIDTITTTPPTQQCFTESPSIPNNTQMFVNYNCIIYPDADGSRSWSGKAVLSNFSIGTTATVRRVCRYSADYNGNGSPLITNTRVVDNFEHPAVYVKVSGSLSRQNFLVVRGDHVCPSAPAVNPDSGVFVDYSTVQLQP